MCNNFFKVCAPCMHMRVDDVTFFFERSCKSVRMKKPTQIHLS